MYIYLSICLLVFRTARIARLIVLKAHNHVPRDVYWLLSSNYFDAAHNCKMAESEEHGSILEDSDMILERREEQEHSEDLGDVS